MARSNSAPAALTRLGFAEPIRAERLLSDPALSGLPVGREDAGELVEDVGRVADPDAALLGLVRLMESIANAPAERTDFIATLSRPGADRERVLAVLGSSTALVDHLVAHPGQWRDIVEASPMSAPERVEELLAAVRAPEPPEADDALRLGYRRQLLGIAGIDLVAADPMEQLPATAAALADLAAAALEAALDIAVREAPDTAAMCRLSIIGMGKAGGRELNYVSDVDVIFVGEPLGEADEQEAMAAGAALATRMMRACSASTAAGSLWPVDPALRPEGKAGPLVRTVASHRSYYERWAKTWEFQALLKARHLAGDPTIGASYLDAIRPMVWQAASRPDFVEDVQAMRRRVEDNIPPGEIGRQLKLGPGGLRDVEFSVQLLQLVHGRSDDRLRSGTTLDALAALTKGGYVAREDAAALDQAYRVLRTLEHRIQLHRLRRTHLMPTAPEDLRRLGRALGHRADPATAVVKQWQSHAAEVRRLHQRIFYRPLLSAVARLSSAEAKLAPEAARERLAALGFRDPGGALRHLEALSSGVSRRAAIQRTLLPVMLGWFADESDPDAGLLAFRKVSDELGSSHWYLKMLRDEGGAAERLAHVLGRSRFAGELLVGAPEAVQMLGDSGGLTPRTAADLIRRMDVAAKRRDAPVEQIAAIRALRRVELFRVAVADLDARLELREVGTALTDIIAAVIQSALTVAIAQVEAEQGPLVTRLLVVGMGRLGGGECGYASDADVLFVHDPLPGASEEAATAQATAVVHALRSHLSAGGSDLPVVLDADLRPEGRSGPIVRSLAAYRSYYERWSLIWEAQALVRATPLAGDAELGERFVALINPIRLPPDGLTHKQVREIRTLKARMESERLPKGADRRTHLKLGTGGLSDVEWTVQLLQMRHGHDRPELQVTSTLAALEGCRAAGLIADEDAEALAASWSLASRLRNAATLYRGRPMDSLPSDPQDANGVARILGHPPGSGQQVAEEYRRIARHARSAMERVFFDSPQ